jgi:hypothetical protein
VADLQIHHPHHRHNRPVAADYSPGNKHWSAGLAGIGPWIGAVPGGVAAAPDCQVGNRPYLPVPGVAYRAIAIHRSAGHKADHPGEAGVVAGCHNNPLARNRPAHCYQDLAGYGRVANCLDHYNGPFYLPLILFRIYHRQEAVKQILVILRSGGTFRVILDRESR